MVSYFPKLPGSSLPFLFQFLSSSVPRQCCVFIFGATTTCLNREAAEMPRNGNCRMRDRQAGSLQSTHSASTTAANSKCYGSCSLPPAAALLYYVLPSAHAHTEPGRPAEADGGRAVVDSMDSMVSLSHSLHRSLGVSFVLYIVARPPSTRSASSSTCGVFMDGWLAGWMDSPHTRRRQTNGTSLVFSPNVVQLKLAVYDDDCIYISASTRPLDKPSCPPPLSPALEEDGGGGGGGIMMMEEATGDAVMRRPRSRRYFYIL